LPYWKRTNWIVTFRQMVRELILMNNNSFLVRLLRWSHLSGDVFGLHDRQILSHLTSLFCGDFLKERSAAINQQAWKSLCITFRRLLPAVSSRFFEKLQSTHKNVDACHQEGGGRFQHLL
jgi:hypothetical protein